MYNLQNDPPISALRRRERSRDVTRPIAIRDIFFVPELPAALVPTPLFSSIAIAIHFLSITHSLGSRAAGRHRVPFREELL